MAVLFLFLFNLRTAAISITAIPLSLLGAVMFLERLGLSLNTMTLGGLAIAIGQVVDDAVIDVENILRRLRENRRLENPVRFLMSSSTPRLKCATPWCMQPLLWRWCLFRC